MKDFDLLHRNLHFKASMDPPLTPHLSSRPIRWRKGELIGAGAFGSVYMGMNLDSGELLAVKQVLIAANSVAKDKAQAHVRELEEELKLLQNLSHPNIVRYLGTAREDDALNIFLEFVPGGSIASLLGKFGSFPEAVIRMYTRQLLQGLQYLHKNGIMHRDIKGANILVDNKGCIKLADFGASKQVVELVTLSGSKSMKGTPYWMAPEVIRQTGHGLPADIWSVGCTIIEMATGKPPWSQQFQEVAALFHIGTTKSHPPIPEHLSLEAQDFLLKCLKKEPHLRPTATELLEHPFANPDEYSSTVSGSSQLSEQISQAVDGCKRRHLDIGSKLNPLVESAVRHSLGFFRKSHFIDMESGKTNQCSEPDVNCSVILDTDSFSSFKSTSEPPKFYDAGWDQFDFNPMAEPTSFNPVSDPSYLNDSWGNHPETNKSKDMVSLLENKKQHGMKDNSEFSFQRLSADDDDDDDEEVTELKIKAFLDEKALELKRLQTPLYMEFKSIHNVAGDMNNVRTEGFPTPLSQVQQVSSTSKSSLSKNSTHSGLSIACSRESEFSVCSDSPSATNNRSVNFYPHGESPRLNEWKGLLLETQQPLPSPRVLNSSEQQRLWKEELQRELEMRREEKRMRSRDSGSTKLSSVSKSASLKEPVVPMRHSVCRAL